MLQTTNHEVLNTQAIEDKKNKAISANANNGIVGGGVGGSIENLSTIVNLAKSKSTKLKRAGLPNIKANSGTDFLTPRAKKAFIHLQKAFTKALILRHFNPKRHIRIETDTSGYAMSRALNQMISDHLNHLNQSYSNHATYENLDLIFSKSKIGQWHPIVFFFWKMIFIETWYKTYNQELLVIVEAFKTWHYYLEECKYEVFVLTYHNNLCWFIDTKSLSSLQVHWAKELSWYHF